ncbi:tRNA (adenosine(37)-N6)-dimethylallyltransferase MiaA [Sphingomicrobium arenosum]|uniref:tRNA (adenosine(37)-N6)-dimethylallyltransferase MiaA n=1 Tax=Sphingomicrobium arenosum TaxID=2233861 RepID=UPI00223F439A|nr:tRNA (adenosine(37)-N6)-dimethylallyltransferase MiaA [Sphingomicrobium arenosum]
MKPPLALIAGPTASGKSELALRLAEADGGIVINADSAQIYADLSILAASPAAAEQARAPHRLYGVRDGAHPCSAGDWVRLARDEIASAHAAGKLPILVGGTGLYLRSLLQGIAPVPDIDPAIRTAIRKAPTADNYAALQQEDPEAAARLNAGDTLRVARALEVIRSTGQPLSYWQARKEGGIGDDVQLRPLLLLPPRDWLAKRCNRRFETMVEHGALDEARALLARDLDPILPVMRAIGVPELIAHLSGETSLADAIAAGQLATRQYMKRQYTWFRGQTPDDWPRYTDPLDSEAAIIAALALLDPPA